MVWFRVDIAVIKITRSYTPQSKKSYELVFIVMIVIILFPNPHFIRLTIFKWVLESLFWQRENRKQEQTQRKSIVISSLKIELYNYFCKLICNKETASKLHFVRIRWNVFSSKVIEHWPTVVTFSMNLLTLPTWKYNREILLCNNTTSQQNNP